MKWPSRRMVTWPGCKNARIAYEPAGPERLGRLCLSPFAEGRLMKFGTIGAGVVHFGRHTEMRLRQLRRMLGRYVGTD